ncbi:MAG TPA: SPOR domain-containing protein [Marinagarivorans sp.]
MDDGLKQRLIGAIVLLAIAVIFIPALFDRETITPVSTETQVPPMPVIELAPIEVAEAPEVVSPAPEPEAMFIPDETQPEPETPAPPSLNDDGVPSGWIIQVISYSEKAKAETFRDRLIDEGYHAYLRDAQSAKGLHYRVYVGPKLDKKAILADKDAIDKKYKLNSILLDMTPKS